jgi:hypothetical protein
VCRQALFGREEEGLALAQAQREASYLKRGLCSMAGGCPGVALVPAAQYKNKGAAGALIPAKGALILRFLLINGYE